MSDKNNDDHFDLKIRLCLVIQCLQPTTREQP